MGVELSRRVAREARKAGAIRRTCGCEKSDNRRVDAGQYRVGGFMACDPTKSDKLATASSKAARKMATKASNAQGSSKRARAANSCGPCAT